MNKDSYTPEQQKDIEERVAKAKQMLEELHLQPAVVMQPVNLGNDVFGLKPIPFLQDTKYTSPVKKTDL